MRCGATSGKSFNEGCEAGLPDELGVDLSEICTGWTAGSADWSSFKSFVTDGQDDASAFSLTGLILEV
jgi:hypothetical protein